MLPALREHLHNNSEEAPLLSSDRERQARGREAPCVGSHSSEWWSQDGDCGLVPHPMLLTIT